MPWETPTLKQTRTLVRDMIRGALPGADANVPNSVLRVMSDNQGALCHLTLQYIDWLALQLIPDTAETEWLDRHGDIWLTNADGSTGRKVATLASGTATFTSDIGVSILIPLGMQLATQEITYETTEQFLTSANGEPTPGPIRALDPGKAGNQEPGTRLQLLTLVPVSGLNGQAIVESLDGGADEENDDDLRVRVLQRIRQPPMGGAQHDYVRWALAVPGVTRAWCAPLEMGIGTVTVRFLMDELRADNDGWPIYTDILTVTEYINTVRPVAVKDFWVLAPIKQHIDAYIKQLTPDTVDVRANIEASLQKMLRDLAKPGQTIYAAWKSFAIMNAPDVQSFQLVNNMDDIMESAGHMAVLGDIVYLP